MAERWVEVGDGVLARRHEGLDLTTGLLLGGDRALVVDTGADAAHGARLRDAVRELTTLPLVVVLTHAHFDHCFGSGALLPAPLLAHPRCRAVLAATAADQRAEWVAHHRDHGDTATADALAATDPPLPDTDVTAETTIDLGGRVVTVWHPGRGHTDHDVVVRADDVLFAGDLLEQGAPPDPGDAVVTEWPGTVAALLDLDVATYVPGHGDPMDRAAVRDQQVALAAVAALFAQVARGELDAVTADGRSPVPGVRWPTGRT